MNDPHSRTTFAGLDDQTTTSLPAWYAETHDQPESVTFAEAIRDLPRATTTEIAFRDPYAEEWVETERFTALVEPMRLLEGARAETALFHVPTDSYAVINPTDVYGPLEDVLREEEIDDTPLAELVFTGLVGVASLVTDVRPLHVAQPLVACVGAAAVVAAVAVAARLVPARWTGRQRRLVVLAVGLTLAIEGLFVRRTGVPDEEAVGLLLVPLLALAAHRLFVTRRPAWAALVGLLAVVLPPLHNFSSAIAALTLTGLAAVHVARGPSRGTIGLGAAVGLGFWAYFVGFFAAAERVGLRLTYTGLLRDHLGAFVAWVVLLAVLAAWLGTTTDRARRRTAALAIGPWFVLAGANLLVPLFPGTIQTPPLVLALVLAYVVPVALFAAGMGRLSDAHGPLVIGLVAGPVAMAWYTLTTSVTPEFWGALQRAQTFAHAGVVAVAGLAAVAIARRRPGLGRVAVGCLVVAAVVSVPLAFVHLDTGTAPRTVHESEFAAASFATLRTDGYASDQRLGRVGPLYHETTVNTTLGPVKGWLAGGPPPTCPTLVQAAWTTDGAHFFPTSPGTISTGRLDAWRARNDRVYDVGGWTTTSLVVPSRRTRAC